MDIYVGNLGTDRYRLHIVPTWGSDRQLRLSGVNRLRWRTGLELYGMRTSSGINSCMNYWPTSRKSSSWLIRLSDLVLEENAKLKTRLHEAEQARSANADKITSLWTQQEESDKARKETLEKLNRVKQELGNSRQELGIMQREQRENGEQVESQLVELERDLCNARTELTGLKSRRNFEENMYKQKCDTLERELELERTKPAAVACGHMEMIERLETALEQTRQSVREYEDAMNHLQAEAVAEPDADKFDVVSDLTDDREGWLQAIERLLKQREDEASRVRSIMLSKDHENSRAKRLKAATDAALLKEREKHKLTKASLDVIEKKHEGVESWVRLLTGPTPTLRSMLVTAMSAANVEEATAIESSVDPLLSEHFSMKDIHLNMLDQPLVPEDVYRFLDMISRSSLSAPAFDSLELESCSICEEEKFIVRSSYGDCKLPLNEFSPEFGQTKCCNKAICSACYSNFFRSAIRNDWWHNLESEEWLRCPVKSCKHPMGITSSAKLAVRIQDFKNIDVDMVVQS
jgi:hypothetical protein